MPFNIALSEAEELHVCERMNISPSFLKMIRDLPDVKQLFVEFTPRRLLAIRVHTKNGAYFYYNLTPKLIRTDPANALKFIETRVKEWMAMENPYKTENRRGCSTMRFKSEREVRENLFIESVLELDPTMLESIRVIPGIKEIIVNTSPHSNISFRFRIETNNGAYWEPAFSLSLCKRAPERVVDFVRRKVDEINAMENPRQLTS